MKGSNESLSVRHQSVIDFRYYSKGRQMYESTKMSSAVYIQSTQIKQERSGDTDLSAYLSPSRRYTHNHLDTLDTFIGSIILLSIEKMNLQIEDRSTHENEEEDEVFITATIQNTMLQHQYDNTKSTLSEINNKVTERDDDIIPANIISTHGIASRSNLELDGEGIMTEDDVDKEKLRLVEAPSRTTMIINPSNDTLAPFTISSAEEEEMVESQQILTSQSTFDSETMSVHSGTGGALMNNKMSEIMRGWSNKAAPGGLTSSSSIDSKEDKKIPNFQPGDHVVRWKVRGY